MYRLLSHRVLYEVSRSHLNVNLRAAGFASVHHLASRNLALQNPTYVIPENWYRGEAHLQDRDKGADRKWEILGELAVRLHHKEEAKDAFQRCIEAKFSAKAYARLLETYAAEGDLPRSLDVAVRLTVYHHRSARLCLLPGLVKLMPDGI